MSSCLPVPLSEIYENIRDYYVYEINEEVVGCCALHVVWEDLAEILGLAVKPECSRKGIGSKLVSACLEDARISLYERGLCSYLCA